MIRALVVDANVISCIIKGDSRSKEFGRVMEGRQSVLSFMTVAQLERWALARHWGATRLKEMRDFIARCVTHHSDEGSCRHWAEIMHASSRAGRPMPAQDAWVAAAALGYDCPLLTNNAKDFASVPALRLMPIE